MRWFYEITNNVLQVAETYLEFQVCSCRCSEATELVCDAADASVY